LLSWVWLQGNRPNLAR